MPSPRTPDLSAWDRALLDPYLWFYRELDTGVREPSTPAQRHFRLVCQFRARARTQHEIAYSRLTALERRGIYPYPKHRVTRGKLEVSPEPSSFQGLIPQVPATRPATSFEVVDVIENAEFTPGVNGHRRRLFDGIKDLYKSGRAKAASVSADASLWVSTILADRSLSGELTDWLTDQYGHLSNVYTKAMDGAFANGLKAGADYISPSLHRLFDGHSLPEAWQRVRDALPDDTAWGDSRVSGKQRGAISSHPPVSHYSPSRPNATSNSSW